MNFYAQSCDRYRRDALEVLQHLEPGLDSIMAQCQYFSQVDDRATTNNYEILIKDVTKKCQKMSNTKLWVPVNPNINLERLVDQFGFNWPKKAEETFSRVKTIFSEIDNDYEKKGVKSASIRGVKQYEPNNAGPSHPATTPRFSAANGQNFNSPSRGNSSNRQHHKQTSSSIHTADEEYNPILDDERLKNIDRKIVERILSEVAHQKQDTKWDDIAGLENVKQAINEIVVYPMQNPDLFKGLLAPAKGLLLFGPPGTGKTLIGKCIASESGATFFAISASSLTSKWIGEGEKMVRALFAVARCMQPSVVFIDEIDSLLTQRTDGEHDSTRKMKTEFLVQFDGVSTAADDRLLIVGATNRPQELDEAARRRFTKRLYIPLPDPGARRQIISKLMTLAKSGLTDKCIKHIVANTEGYSGADMATLCKEAALCSIRSLIQVKGSARDLASDDLPDINRENFDDALTFVKASVSSADLGAYEDWDSKYGASNRHLKAS